MEYTLSRRDYGEFAHGTLKEMWYKAKHEARELRRAYKGQSSQGMEHFYIKDAQGNRVAKVICKPMSRTLRDEKCYRARSGRPIYRYYYEAKESTK